MGFIADLFDSSKGAGFQAKAADITNPTDQGQIDQAYKQTQQGLGQQQAFLQALQGQNGIGNQSSVFNQLQGVASGQGPNPAQTALANATGQNVAQQGALMASQRGTGANTGLMARQAANQGANIQQQSAGQAANMQANQSLNALNQMGGIAGQQVGQQAGALQNYNQAAQNQQGNLLNAQGAFNQNQVAMQSNQNNANQAMAAGNQKAQGDLFGGLMSGLGSAAQGIAMSDERQKKNIRNADGQVQQFLDNTGAHQYEYKNPHLPGASPGQHVSPMAQELEKSKLGSQMVQESPNGKMIDYSKAAPVMMAALSQLNKRLEAMEGGRHTSPPTKMADGGYVGVSGQGAQAQMGNLKEADMSGFKKGLDSLMGAMKPSGAPKTGLEGVDPSAGTPMAGDPMQAMPEMPGAMPGIPGLPPEAMMLAARGGRVPAIRMAEGGQVPGSPQPGAATPAPASAAPPAASPPSSPPSAPPAAAPPAAPAAPSPPPAAAPAAAPPPPATGKSMGTSTGNSPTRTNTETGGSSPGGASTGGVGSGIGGAGTGGAATGGASTGGAGTVNVTISGNSGTGSNSDGSKPAPITINISNVGGRTDAGSVASGDGPGAEGEGGSGEGSGGGGGGAAPDEPANFSSGSKNPAKETNTPMAHGGQVNRQAIMQQNRARMQAIQEEERQKKNGKSVRMANGGQALMGSSGAPSYVRDPSPRLNYAPAQVTADPGKYGKPMSKEQILAMQADSARQKAEAKALDAQMEERSKAALASQGFARGGQANPKLQQSMVHPGRAKSYVHGRLMEKGGHVPGKAMAKGDNYKNDTVKALLSPGEIVIPRSIATGRNAPAKAAEFVAAILAKQGMKSSKK